MLIVGHRDLMARLNHAPEWHGDGTFKTAPPPFKQVYSLHAKVGDSTPPLVYIFLMNKRKQTYITLLREVSSICGGYQPQSILIDFEISFWQAVRDIFPNCHLQGCHFHLTKSIQRKTKEVGAWGPYLGNENFRQAVQCLTALACVPVAHVENAFDEVVRSYIFQVGEDDLQEKLENIVQYFSNTYIRERQLLTRVVRPQFPPPTWNCYLRVVNGEPRTTNSVEGWHNATLKCLTSTPPTLWASMDMLKGDMAIQFQTILNIRAGAPRAPKHPAFVRKMERLQRACRLFDPGHPDYVDYLLGIVAASTDAFE